MIDVEITVAEGGTWLKLQVSKLLLVEWLNGPRYSTPRLDDTISICTVKCSFGIYDFITNKWELS